MVPNKIDIQITKHMHILNSNEDQLSSKQLSQINPTSITTDLLSIQMEIETRFI